MVDELNTSATPNDGGDDKASTNKADNEVKREPEKIIKPRKREIKKWFGLTKTQWKELAGFLVLIPWLYYDLSDSHGILKLSLLAVSLAIAQGVVLSFLKGRSKALSLWLVCLVPIAIIVWENSMPEKKPEAHFKFMLTSSTAPNDTLELTNKLLYHTWSSAFGKTNLSTVVVLPRDSAQSSVWLALGVINDSSVAADGVEIMISLPAGWKCMAAPPWQQAVSRNTELSLVSPGVLATNPMGSWTFEFSSAILAGDGAQLPPIRIDQIEETRSFIVMAKWKNAPAETMSCSLWFPPTNRIFVKHPVVAVATNNGAGLAVMDIPDELIVTNSSARNVMPKTAQ